MEVDEKVEETKRKRKGSKIEETRVKEEGRKEMEWRSGVAGKVEETKVEEKYRGENLLFGFNYDEKRYNPFPVCLSVSLSICSVCLSVCLSLLSSQRN